MAAALVVAAAVTASADGRQEPPRQEASDPEATGEVGWRDGHERAIPPAPTPRPSGERPLSPQAAAAVERALAELAERGFPRDGVEQLVASGDLRLLWVLSDISWPFGIEGRTAVARAAASLSGAGYPNPRGTQLRDWLFAWDLPAPPGYAELKGRLFTLIEPAWQPFFDDQDALIDWRWVGWGGVFIDDRIDTKGSEGCLRGCIPALDDPAVTAASAGGWYPDDAIVFGIAIDGEARAYPKHMMEVHEMVNDTLGGRRIGIPYCTLCLSAQAYLLDQVDGFQPLLRTSGLLSRSNKFMYDRNTWSAINTFTGRALSGPLRDAGVTLEQVTMVTSTWQAWREAYPRTTILA